MVESTQYYEDSINILVEEIPEEFFAAVPGLRNVENKFQVGLHDYYLHIKSGAKKKDFIWRSSPDGNPPPNLAQIISDLDELVEAENKAES